MSNLKRTGDPHRLPEPRSLAVADSFLNSFAAEPAATSNTAGAIKVFSVFQSRILARAEGS